MFETHMENFEKWHKGAPKEYMDPEYIKYKDEQLQIIRENKVKEEMEKRERARSYFENKEEIDKRQLQIKEIEGYQQQKINQYLSYQRYLNKQ